MVSPRVLSAVLLLATVVACSGGSAAPQPDGPLQIGIVAGQNQSVGAGTVRLPAPVVGKLVRLPNGTVGFRWLEQPMNRALDVVVPRAYAQSTTLQGAPVVGAVVCAKSVDPAHPLEPAVPCTNTDANGQVTFVFEPGTKAGTALAVVQGMNAGVVATYDTARAVVLPDLASLAMQFDTLGQNLVAADPTIHASWMVAGVHAGDTIDLATHVTRAVDQYGNVVTDYSLGWTLAPLTSETFTATGRSGSYLPPPPAYAAAPTAAHTGNVVSGFQPGYMVLTVFAGGNVQAIVLVAVFP